jgi:hypothetical protein
VYYEKVPGDLTDPETAFDYVILVLGQPSGNTIGYVGTKLYESAWNNLSSWQCVGYDSFATIQLTHNFIRLRYYHTSLKQVAEYGNNHIGIYTSTCTGPR